MIPAQNDWLCLAWTQTWQVTLLIAAVGLLTRLFAANRPQLAFVLWLVVILKCLAPPLWSSPVGAFCRMQTPQKAAADNSPGTLTVMLLPLGEAADSARGDLDASPAEEKQQTCRWGMEPFRPVVLLTAIWVGGIVAMFVGAVLRLRRVSKLIRRADATASAAYTAAMAKLVRRLKISRRVRLVVTEEPVGPAVVGLIRPTILLPRAVSDGKSAAEIELILAHELTHVRRGDLWFALPRSLAQSLWWFHPLVWWASRRASREAERCCDEAVLAEMRCHPARYARCLLDILEIKHRLLSVPAFPGVRAIEVNQGRLERIMKIGNRGYRRTPRWCWAIALLTAVAVLPGAAIRLAADEGTAALTPAASSGIGAGVSGENDKIDKTQEYLVGYRVKDVLSAICAERGLSESEAQKFLEDCVKNSAVDPTQVSHKPADFCILAWYNGDLIVEANQTGHKQVAEMVEAFRKGGTAQIAVEVRFVTLHDEELSQLLPDWATSPMNVDEADLADPAAVRPAAFARPLGNHEGTRVARAQLLIEKDSPVRYRILEAEDGQKLIERCQGDVRSNVLQAPKVTVFNGQTAFVSDTSKKPFVVGVVPVGPEALLQPQIREVSEGTMLQLRAVADRSGEIHLDFAATFSQVQEVETASFARNAGDKADTTIQIPKVATVRMEGGADLKQGQWLLLGGSESHDQTAKPAVKDVSWKEWFFGGGKTPEKQETQELVLMLRAETLRPSLAGNQQTEKQ